MFGWLLHRLEKQTRLHMAARDGDAGRVKDLLAGGADSNARNRSEETPLHLACRQGMERAYDLRMTRAAGAALLYLSKAPGEWIETVRLLLVSGSDVNARDSNGRTPLHCATNTHGNCSWFLSSDLNHCYKTDLGGFRHITDKPLAELILALASTRFSVDVVEMLLDYGADINADSGRGRTPLMSAVFWDDFRERVGEQLTEEGSAIPPTGIVALLRCRGATEQT